MHGRHALLENTLAFDDEVVGELQAIDMDIPVMPLAGPDHRLGLGSRISLADRFSLLFGHQFLSQQLGQLGFKGRRVNAGQVLPHFLPHEDTVGANVHQTSLSLQTCYQLLDLGIDQRLAATNRNHGRIAFVRSCQTLFQRHQVLQRSGILPDATTARAR